MNRSELAVHAPGLDGDRRTRAQRLQAAAGTFAHVGGHAREQRAAPPARDLDIEREQERADAQEDEAERHLAAGEEDARENDGRDRDAEEKRRRRDAEPVRLDARERHGIGVGVRHRPPARRAVAGVSGQRRAACGALHVVLLPASRARVTPLPPAA